MTIEKFPRNEKEKIKMVQFALEELIQADITLDKVHTVFNQKIKRYFELIHYDLPEEETPDAEVEVDIEPPPEPTIEEKLIALGVDPEKIPEENRSETLTFLEKLKK